MQSKMFTLSAMSALSLCMYSTPSLALVPARATLQPVPPSAVVTPAVPPSPVTRGGGQPLVPVVAGDRDEDARAAQRRREAWILALEGVTHAPVDIGVQLGVETPPGVRLFAGYGWVPQAYMDLLTGVAGGASGNSYAQAVLEEADYTGRTWRFQLGFRPFRNLGLYGDVGYAQLHAKGSLDLSETNVPALAALGGGYRADTKLDMWLLELGYQAQFADRVMLALALGVMGTLESTTTIRSVDGAPNSKLLGDAARQGDSALESYGIVPTLTLRLGFDFI
jgi:hypothetical protein